MITIIKPRSTKEIVEHSIEFTNDEGAGFRFDADERGNVILENDCQRESYEQAIANPEEYKQYNEHTVRRFIITEPAVGRCRCGEKVTLESRYYGACQCGRCGQWYNVFGQELVPPECWEE